MMKIPDYIVGLDLGQASELTALCVLERPAAATTPSAPPVYFLRHLQRWTLGTPYAQIVADTATLAGTAPLKGRVTLVADRTAVGRPVVDLLRRPPRPCPVIPVTITGGHHASIEPGGSRLVPMKDLVACVQLLFQTRRLKIAPALPDADVLVKELNNFRANNTAAGNETASDWRAGVQDDLVLAVAVACWWAERGPRPDEGGIPFVHPRPPRW